MQSRLAPLFGLFTALAIQTCAAEFLTTNVYEIAAGQVIADEQWILANSADTEGVFKNDLFIGCGPLLELNGTYEGNVWGMARGDTVMGGMCARNARLAGRSVRIDGTIDGNLMAMADTIIITTNAVIGGKAHLAGNSVIQEGRIRGDVSIAAARVATLGGTLDGHADVHAPDILFSRGAKIGGDLSYTANKELVPVEGVVGGTLQRVIPKSPPLFSADRLAMRMMWFVAAFLAGVPFIAFFPMTSAMASQLAKKAPWRCLWVGFLASGALPIVGIMCLSSVVGLPLGALILASWGIMIYLSRIVVGLVLGTSILRTNSASFGRVLLALAAGLAIIYLATLVPAIGLPVQIAVVWMGTGALILALLQKRRLIIQVPDELKQLEELRQQSKKKEEIP